MIKLKEVSKYYHSDKSVALALKNINLEFKKGEFVAITGQSGSGKSTLINLISGMDSYEEGELYFKGFETSYYDDNDWELYRKNNISFVYQSYNLIDSYTALQNVEAVMMICENDGNRRTKKERRKRAMEMLSRVGLEKQAHNRASHMSSGQKQRLGIARALAKDTDVIIADEPTGNLDEENGKAIMSIFHKLAKEGKLVIVVTHNYEQAEPFATRKIRLFDGEVAEDLRIDEELYNGEDFQSDFSSELQEALENENKTFKTAVRFVHINRLAQPHRSLLIGIFLVVSALAMLVFIGYFAANVDDTKTKKVANEAFLNTDDSRLLVKRLDGKAMEAGDYEAIKKIKHVYTVDMYDRTGDCYYFAEEGEDYKKQYSVGAATKSIDIQKLKYNHFIRSANGLSERDLSCGRLPEGEFEVVLYTEDESLLNTKKEIYSYDGLWQNSCFLGYEFTIVGILKSPTEQIYFSDAFARSLDHAMKAAFMRYVCSIHDIRAYTNGFDDAISDKDRKESCILFINEELKGNQARLSSAITNTLLPEGKDMGDYTWYKTLNEEGTINLLGGSREEFNVSFVQDGSMNSVEILEVSSELFEKIMGEEDMTQAGVYIEDYAYTDQALNDLYAAGYDAISVLRVSAVDYDADLAAERLVILAVSAAVVLVIVILSIFVVYMLMKLKKADFLIFKSLGMKKRMADQMNYYELLTQVLISDILAIAAGMVCSYMEVALISDIMKYMRLNHYIILIVIHCVMAIAAAGFYNRYLAKRFRLTTVQDN